MRAIDQAKAIYPTITKAWVDQGLNNKFAEHAATYEGRCASPESMIHLAMIDNVSKRITDENTPIWRGTYLDVKFLSNTLSHRCFCSSAR